MSARAHCAYLRLLVACSPSITHRAAGQGRSQCRLPLCRFMPACRPLLSLSLTRLRGRAALMSARAHCVGLTLPVTCSFLRHSKSSRAKPPSTQHTGELGSACANRLRPELFPACEAGLLCGVVSTRRSRASSTGPPTHTFPYNRRANNAGAGVAVLTRCCLP